MPAEMIAELRNEIQKLPRSAACWKFSRPTNGTGTKARRLPLSAMTEVSALNAPTTMKAMGKRKNRASRIRTP